MDIGLFKSKLICEICLKPDIIINNNDAYVEHLLSCHKENEIASQVKNSHILNFLGIQVQVQKSEPKTFSFSESSLFKDMKNPFLQKTYNVYQCNLCQNLCNA